MKLFKHQISWASLSALLPGLMVFWAWAGAYTLSPRHIGWVMSGIDTQSQYLAWQFFRLGPWWQWPLGANPAYGSDATGTIVLSDSIPLMALALKPLSGWLHENFQYFGFWDLICFLLQGWFARKLMQRLTGDPLTQLTGTLFFLTASIFLVRIYLHPALAAQWLLLAAFYLALDKEFRSRAWLMLLSIAILVHAYLFVMLAALWGGDLIQRCWRRECSRVQLLSHATIAVMLVTTLMWIVGYFVPASTSAMSIRTHLDLWFPFWTGSSLAGEWSWFLPASNLDILAYDGFGYFGLGFLMLIPVAAVSWLVRWHLGPLKTETGLIPASTWFGLTGICLVLFIYAMGNRVYFAQHLLFSYPLPGWLARIYGVFRGAARMMWPMWYLLLIGTLFLLIRGLGVRHARWVMLLCVILQLGDLSRAAVNIRQATIAAREWKSGLDSPLWGELSARYRHLAYLQPPSVPAGMLSFVTNYRRVANYAATRGLTINIAYLARENGPRLALAKKGRIDLLMRGQAEPSTFYVIDDSPLWARLICVRDSTQWYGVIDGLRLVVPDPPPTLHSIPRVSCAN